MTKKWIEVNHLSSNQYPVNNKVRFKTFTLRSDLCHYTDAFIVVKGIITVEWDNNKTINIG